MDEWAAVTRLAIQQHGLVRRDQVEALGVASATLNRRAVREGWDRPHRGVLALPGSVDGPERRILAAVLAVRHEAWATRWAAAFLWGLTDRLRSPITVVVPHDHRAAPLDRIKVVRSRTLDEVDKTVVAGIPCVTVPRMLADLAAVTDLSTLRGLAIDARQRSLLDPAVLWELWERTRPAPGHRRLLSLAEQLAGGEELVDSTLEWRTRGAIRREGLPAPHPEPYPVEVDGRVVARIDIAWPQYRVGVECEGYRYHSQRRQLDRDSARQNLLLSLDWRLLLVTWAQLQQSPGEVVAQIRRLLEAAGALPRPPGAD